MSGLVYIVGAGPGDPGLITVRGRKCLQSADVVIYDRLVNPELLKEAPHAAELLYVGKESGTHSWSQEKINEQIAMHAVQGRTVVRLKGGDPCVFGRGGEEAAFLAQKGIPFEIVPGVSSAIAVPAFSGIPVTYRGVSNAFAVVTGHSCGDGSEVDFLSLYRSAGTLIVLMGVARLPEIARRLLEGGTDPATPMAVIEKGSGVEQRTTVTTLRDAGRDCLGVRPPAVIVIGRVVGLRESIQWFSEQVLTGHP